MKRFIVASASPRRREILTNAGYHFEVIPSDANENISCVMTPEETVCFLSRRKALAVLENNRDAVVFGCDTVVAIGDEILGKPENDEDAKRMLKMLSGRVHTVSTGVCVVDENKTEVFANTTEVEFYELSDETIESYIATGECSDKAGAYGIQSGFAIHIEKIEGDYFNVVGLPISYVYEELKKL